MAADPDRDSDRDPPREAPLYRGVIETIVARIASGALAPGAMLPSETQLGAELGVSQGTARKALSELEARGLLRRAQGRGTFVAVRTPESALFSFFRLRADDGAAHTPELLGETVTRRPAAPAERAALHGAPETVIEIARLRALGGRPATQEISRVSAALFPGLEARTPLPNALYALYQQAYTVVVVRADERIRATAADAAMAEALALAPGAPVMAVERRAVDMLDRVVELRDSVFAAEGLHYAVSLR
jgi:GntR family transcriptional regulator